MEPVLIGPLISTLSNIQSKIDVATGAATAFELRLRLIAQLESKVQNELKKYTRKPYHRADLEDLIKAVLEVFGDKLNPDEQEKIRNCRMPRNKASHGSFVELMIALGVEPTGRTIDPRTGKRNILPEADLIEGVKSIDRNSGLEKFTQKAREAVVILERKILRSLQPIGVNKPNFSGSGQLF